MKVKHQILNIYKQCLNGLHFIKTKSNREFNRKHKCFEIFHKAPKKLLTNNFPKKKKKKLDLNMHKYVPKVDMCINVKKINK